MDVKQYEMVLVNLDPTIGSEMKKIRPCVVISPNEMNKHLQTIVIAPITSTSKPYPTRFEISHPNTSGWVVIDQVRTIDKQRLIKVLTKLNGKEIQSLKDIIRETYVD